MSTKPPPEEERYEAGPEHPDLFEDPFPETETEPKPDPRPDAEPKDAKPDDLAW